MIIISGKILLEYECFKKVRKFQGEYITTCGQAVLIRLDTENGTPLVPKYACMVYDTRLNPNINPGLRLNQIRQYFQDLAPKYGQKTLKDLQKYFEDMGVYVLIPEAGGVIRCSLEGKDFNDPGFLFPFFEPAKDLDQFMDQLKKPLDLEAKAHMIHQLLLSYTLIFDHPDSDLRFIHNDLFPNNLLVYERNNKYHLVVIDWAGGGFYSKSQKKFILEPLVAGKTAYRNYCVPYEMDPAHWRFDPTTDYLFVANIIFFIISSGGNPFMFLPNISGKLLVETVALIEKKILSFIKAKKVIPFDFPPNEKEWSAFNIKKIRTDCPKKDLEKELKECNETLKALSDVLPDLLYRGIVMGYNQPEYRPLPIDLLVLIFGDDSSATAESSKLAKKVKFSKTMSIQSQKKKSTEIWEKYYGSSISVQPPTSPSTDLTNSLPVQIHSGPAPQTPAVTLPKAKPNLSWQSSPQSQAPIKSLPVATPSVPGPQTPAVTLPKAQPSLSWQTTKPSVKPPSDTEPEKPTP